MGEKKQINTFFNPKIQTYEYDKKILIAPITLNDFYMIICILGSVCT